MAPTSLSDMIPTPMQNAIGMSPIFGRNVSQFSICASCHTIELPVFDRNGRQVLDEHGKPKTEFEQTTAFEWFNSRFFSPPTVVSCQNCHMPSNYRGADLAFKI